MFQRRKSSSGIFYKGKPYRKSFKVSHTLEGLHSLREFLEEVRRETNKKPSIILESTGHYQTPVVQYLEDRGYLLIIINPLLSYKAKSSSLRKVKTDVVDAYQLCELFYKEDLQPNKKRGIQLLNLRNLTRQHENITGELIQTKLQFQAVLDQVFPEYRGVFGDLYSVVSLLTLLEYPSSEDILGTSKETLSEKISGLCKSRSYKWAEEKQLSFKRQPLVIRSRRPFTRVIF